MRRAHETTHDEKWETWRDEIWQDESWEKRGRRAEIVSKTTKATPCLHCSWRLRALAEVCERVEQTAIIIRDRYPRNQTWLTHRADFVDDGERFYLDDGERFYVDDGERFYADDGERFFVDDGERLMAKGTQRLNKVIFWQKVLRQQTYFQSSKLNEEQQASSDLLKYSRVSFTNNKKYSAIFFIET